MVISETKQERYETEERRHSSQASIFLDRPHSTPTRCEDQDERRNVRCKSVFGCGLFPVGCWRWLIWGSSHERYFIFGPFGAPYSRDCILSGYWISHVINTVFHQSTLTQNSLDGTKLGRWHKIWLMAQNPVDDKTRSTRKRKTRSMGQNSKQEVSKKKKRK